MISRNMIFLRLRKIIFLLINTHHILFQCKTFREQGITFSNSGNVLLRVVLCGEKSDTKYFGLKEFQTLKFTNA